METFTTLRQSINGCVSCFRCSAELGSYRDSTSALWLCERRARLVISMSLTYALIRLFFLQRKLTVNKSEFENVHRYFHFWAC